LEVVRAVRNKGNWCWKLRVPLEIKGISVGSCACR
jgi:hypothetical protein